MKSTFLILTVAAQLAAFGASAQTSTTATGAPGAAASTSFGSDWSQTLGSAMFNENGTEVRPATELSTQWKSLSEEDMTMIRRDCAAYMQQSGGASSTTEATGTAGSTDTTATTGAADSTSSTTGSASGSASTDATMSMDVSTTQMEEICAATKDL